MAAVLQEDLLHRGEDEGTRQEVGEAQQQYLQRRGEDDATLRLVEQVRREEEEF